MNRMKIMHYTDTQSVGNSVLIADNGQVAFLEGQPTQMELAAAFAGAKFTDDPTQVERAQACKGEKLSLLVLKKADDADKAASDELTNTLRGILDDALAEAAGEAQVVQEVLEQANTPYRHAVAMNLLTQSQQSNVDKALASTERHLTSSHPMVNLLVRTMEMGRLAMSHAQGALLTVQTEVVDRLHAIAQGEPGQAHAGVLELLEWMGMPVGVCSCCGQEADHGDASDSATGSPGSVQVPGSKHVH